MGFNLFNQPKEIIKEEEKTDSLSQWQVFDKIYEFINTEQYDKNKTNERIDELVDIIAPNELFFTVWGLNHYLLYNEFTRKFRDIFFQTSLFLSNVEYIKFYIKYMVQNEIRFPKYKYWYKPEINKTSSSYKRIIKETLKLDDKEVDEFIEYYSNKGMSAREICFMLKNPKVYK